MTSVTAPIAASAAPFDASSSPVRRRAPSLAHWSDARLTARAITGEDDAFAELAARHAPRVQRMCHGITGCPEDAADAMQEALLAVMRRLPQMAGREVEFAPYLAVAARHAAYRICKRRSRRRATEVGGDACAASVPDQGTLGPEAALLLAQDRDAVRRALEALPERHRDALLLHHAEGLPTSAVADRLGGNANAAAQLLFRARRGLRTEFERSA